MRAAIVGLAGPALSRDEADWLRRWPPCGIILFARNIQNPAQLADLTASLRAILPPDAVLMVDQEGGRVARLRPPHWLAHPTAEAHGALPPGQAARAAWLTGALIGLDCAEAGFDVACAPVLDRRVPGAHDVIGDRAFSQDPAIIVALARQMAAGLLVAGIQPVGKHAPGHGQAGCDSHLALPRVSRQTEQDLHPFTALAAELPWMMTAHVLYEQWDTARPGTVSPIVLGQIVREKIGFDGVLVSDDLAMKALSGAPDQLARAALDAGCDVALYCAGDAATESVLAETPLLTAQAAFRLAQARRRTEAARQTLDRAALLAERDLIFA